MYPAYESKVKSGGFARLREAGHSRAFIVRQGLKEGRLLKYSVTLKFHHSICYIILSDYLPTVNSVEHLG